MKNKIKVCLIEDNKYFSNQIVNMLLDDKVTEFEVKALETLKESVSYISSNKFDIIILDLNLPDCMGFDTFIEIHKQFSDIPIIILSGDEDERIALKAIKYGAQDYLMKREVKANLLIRSIHYAVQRRIERKQAEEALRNLNEKLKLNNEKLVESYKKLVNEINERKKVENELLEANATKDKFFSIIAHDLKNPLFAFKNVIEVLTSMFDELSDNEKKDFLMDMKKSTDNLSNLLENLLTWSRSQRGLIKYNPEKINLLQISNNIISLMNLNAEKKNIIINNFIDKDLDVFADESMLATIIRNLLSNAIKFTNIGGKVDISAKTFLNNSNKIICEYSVIDNGIGMTKEYISNLFKIDATNSLDGTALEKGTGLGLILCKEFININKGEIFVDSDYNKGTTFKFTLPIPDSL